MHGNTHTLGVGHLLLLTPALERDLSLIHTHNTRQAQHVILLLHTSICHHPLALAGGLLRAIPVASTRHRLLILVFDTSVSIIVTVCTHLSMTLLTTNVDVTVCRVGLLEDGLVAPWSGALDVKLQQASQAVVILVDSRMDHHVAAVCSTDLICCWLTADQAVGAAVGEQPDVAAICLADQICIWRTTDRNNQLWHSMVLALALHVSGSGFTYLPVTRMYVQMT